MTNAWDSAASEHYEAPYNGLPVKQESPNYCPGSYVLHFYCDSFFQGHSFSEFPVEYPADSRSECLSYARKDGWIFHKDRTATCPKCAKALGIGKFKPKANGGAL